MRKAIAIVGAGFALMMVGCDASSTAFPSAAYRSTKGSNLPAVRSTAPMIRYFVSIDRRLKEPYFLAFSRTGVPWFTPSTRHLGLMPAPGKFEARGLSIKRTGDFHEEPSQIILGPDGHLWFTDGHGESIGTVNSQGKPLQYRTGQAGDTSGIVTGPRNHLWVTISGWYSTQLAEFDTTPRLLKLWKLNGTSCYQETIASGPRNVLWVGSSHNCQKITRFTPDGRITDFPVSAYYGVSGITEGRDGNMWFGGVGGPYAPWYISKITPSGNIAEYRTSSMVGYVAAGPDGNMWFTEPLTGAIGYVTMQGVVTEYKPSTNLRIANRKKPRGSVLYRVAGIVRGPDGNMWFASPDGDGLGEVVLSASHR